MLDQLPAELQHKIYALTVSPLTLRLSWTYFSWKCRICSNIHPSAGVLDPHPRCVNDYHHAKTLLLVCRKIRQQAFPVVRAAFNILDVEEPQYSSMMQCEGSFNFLLGMDNVRTSITTMICDYRLQRPPPLNMFPQLQSLHIQNADCGAASSLGGTTDLEWAAYLMQTVFPRLLMQRRPMYEIAMEEHQARLKADRPPLRLSAIGSFHVVGMSHPGALSRHPGYQRLRFSPSAPMEPSDAEFDVFKIVEVDLVKLASGENKSDFRELHRIRLVSEVLLRSHKRGDGAIRSWTEERRKAVAKTK